MKDFVEEQVLGALRRRFIREISGLGTPNAYDNEHDGKPRH